MISVETINEFRFYLIHCGKNYTNSDIGRMTMDEMLWHVRRLTKVLEEERKHYEEQQRRAQVSPSARRFTPRRR